MTAEFSKCLLNTQTRTIQPLVLYGVEVRLHVPRSQASPSVCLQSRPFLDRAFSTSPFQVLVGLQYDLFRLSSIFQVHFTFLSSNILTMYPNHASCLSSSPTGNGFCPHFSRITSLLTRVCLVSPTATRRHLISLAWILLLFHSFRDSAFVLLVYGFYSCFARLEILFLFRSFRNSALVSHLWTF